jgi:K+-sensing histidine kinase KdpD
VEQVLRKLLHEAISATDLGIVALHASRPGAALVRIEVHDGALLPGDPAQLFAPLQAGGAATAAPSALSLALMLSHRLARLMGGDLAARKGAVQGRVFVLTLPSDDLPAA